MAAPASPGGSRPLVLTGERTLPGIPEENYWFARHVAAYEFAADVLSRRATDGPVLDSGCGEGYGTNLLRRRLGASRTVVGLDTFGDAVAHARHTYSGAVFVRADVASTPAAADSFGAIVSLQVIEHVADPERYVREMRRLLAAGGTAVVGTPNRLTFTPAGRPKNPFHIVEFAPEELRALLARHFGSVELHGLHDSAPGLADILVESAFAGTDPPSWAAALVPTVQPGDFTISSVAPDCLDLVATCTA